ncbi:MAG: hypothetical protein K9L88_18580, partial [Chromatiaceae bacterium]|nr:hypothetical protein [Chromatiaceae bacterium]
GMNLRELERLAHIDKIASGLSADEKHATKDDPNVINNRNMIENLKRQHRRAQESQQAFNDEVAATAELLERCAKYAARRGYKLGTGWLASAARPQPYDFMREPMHGAETDIARQRDQRRGVIL